MTPHKFGLWFCLLEHRGEKKWPIYHDVIHELPPAATQAIPVSNWQWKLYFDVLILTKQGHKKTVQWQFNPRTFVSRKTSNPKHPDAPLLFYKLGLHTHFLSMVQVSVPLGTIPCFIIGYWTPGTAGNWIVTVFSRSMSMLHSITNA